jgi:hypothetical protein
VSAATARHTLERTKAIHDRAENLEQLGDAAMLLRLERVRQENV